MSLTRRLAKKLKKPRQVQDFLRGLPYNREKDGETLSSAETALRRGTAHCFEAAFIAAAILEHHGYPPMIMSLESRDLLDHIIYVFQEKGKWGAIARSRDEGLHGRPPRYRTARDLAMSYFDPYVDKKARITAYQVVPLDDCGVDWRASKKNVWKAERYLIGLKHVPLKSSKTRHARLRAAFIRRGPMPRQKHWW